MNSKVASSRKYNSMGRKMPIYRHPWFYVAIVLAVAALVFGMWFAFFRNNSKTPEPLVDTSNNSIGTVTPSEAKSKSENIEKEDENAETGKKQTPTQYDGEDPNSLEEITGYISYSAVNQDHLSIRLTINQFLTSGTCNLTMTSGSSTVTKSAEVIGNASTATCQGFDIPLSELPSDNWNISIKITSGDKTGTITGDTTL